MAANTGLVSLGGTNGIAALVSQSGQQLTLDVDESAIPGALMLGTGETLVLQKQDGTTATVTGDAAGYATVPGGGSGDGVSQLVTPSGVALLWEEAPVT